MSNQKYLSSLTILIDKIKSDIIDKTKQNSIDNIFSIYLNSEEFKSNLSKYVNEVIPQISNLKPIFKKIKNLVEEMMDCLLKNLKLINELKNKVGLIDIDLSQSKCDKKENIKHTQSSLYSNFNKSKGLFQDNEFNDRVVYIKESINRIYSLSTKLNIKLNNMKEIVNLNFSSFSCNHKYSSSVVNTINTINTVESSSKQQNQTEHTTSSSKNNSILRKIFYLATNKNESYRKSSKTSQNNSINRKNQINSNRSNRSSLGNIEIVNLKYPLIISGINNKTKENLIKSQVVFTINQKKENKEKSFHISNFHLMYSSSYKSSDNFKREISMKILKYLNNKKDILISSSSTKITSLSEENTQLKHENRLLENEINEYEKIKEKGRNTLKNIYEQCLTNQIFDEKEENDINDYISQVSYEEFFKIIKSLFTQVISKQTQLNKINKILEDNKIIIESRLSTLLLEKNILNKEIIDNSDLNLRLNQDLNQKNEEIFKLIQKNHEMKGIEEELLLKEGYLNKEINKEILKNRDLLIRISHFEEINRKRKGFYDLEIIRFNHLPIEFKIKRKKLYEINKQMSIEFKSSSQYDKRRNLYIDKSIQFQLRQINRHIINFKVKVVSAECQVELLSLKKNKSKSCLLDKSDNDKNDDLSSIEDDDNIEVNYEIYQREKERNFVNRITENNLRNDFKLSSLSGRVTNYKENDNNRRVTDIRQYDLHNQNENESLSRLNEKIEFLQSICHNLTEKCNLKEREIQQLKSNIKEETLIIEDTNSRRISDLFEDQEDKNDIMRILKRNSSKNIL